MIQTRAKKFEQKVQKRIETLPWWAVLLLGIAAALIGIFLLVSPKATATQIFQLLGLFFLIAGVLSLFGLLRDRRNWGWKVFAGVLGIIVGLVFLFEPTAAAYLGSAIVVWFLGTAAILVGIALIIQGVAYAGWGHTVLGIVALIFGILVILLAALGALTMPWVFGVLALVGGVLLVVDSIRMARGKAIDKG
jgi:uncharacterized membrane protein HdeD (DUF308 family)